MMNQLEALGETQACWVWKGNRHARQLLGIELNERAAAMAELVLWIGYLQWHIRTRGNKAGPNPWCMTTAHEHRDAVLESDESNSPTTRTASCSPAGTARATSPTRDRRAGADEAALVPQWNPINPRQALGAADFIVGNHPSSVPAPCAPRWATVMCRPARAGPKCRERRFRDALVEPRCSPGGLGLGAQVWPDHHQQPAPDL